MEAVSSLSSSPWRDWDEWRQVRSDFFSEEEGKRECALQQVGVWRSRKKLPTSIEGTAMLVEALLQDAKAELSEWGKR